jgi:hypothetical protein
MYKIKNINVFIVKLVKYKQFQFHMQICNYKDF